MVEGILSLFASRPKADRDTLHATEATQRNRKVLPQDGSPFRDLYRECQDEDLWRLLVDYFSLVKRMLWGIASEDSFIRKTIGVQALFDVLRTLGLRYDRAVLIDKALSVLAAVESIDFADDFFQASGKGRVRVRNVILKSAGLIDDADLPAIDRPRYMQLLRPSD